MSTLMMHMDRREAGRLLRRARRLPLGTAETAEAIDWVFAAMPHSRAARLLKIRLLLHEGDHASADALITQALMLWPTDLAFTLLRAQRLMEQNHPDAAQRELRLILLRRPGHVDALLLAGRIEQQQRRFGRAAALFGRVGLICRGSRRDIALRLHAQALLDDGQIAAAAGVIDRLAEAAPDLRAALCMKQQRVRDAVEILQRALGDPACAIDPQALRIQLIDALEQSGDLQELRQLLASAGSREPRVQLRAALVWLSMGEFRSVVRQMARLTRNPEFRAPALMVLTAAAVLAGRSALADRAQHRLHRQNLRIDARFMAEAWRRGLLGRELFDQQRFHPGGADPNPSQLRPLLQRAVHVLTRAAVQPTMPAESQAELNRLRSICATALDQHEQTAQAV